MCINMVPVCTSNLAIHPGSYCPTVQGKVECANNPGCWRTFPSLTWLLGQEIDETSKNRGSRLDAAGPR